MINERGMYTLLEAYHWWVMSTAGFFFHTQKKILCDPFPHLDRRNNCTPFLSFSLASYFFFYLRQF